MVSERYASRLTSRRQKSEWNQLLPQLGRVNPSEEQARTHLSQQYGTEQNHKTWAEGCPLSNSHAVPVPSSLCYLTSPLRPQGGDGAGKPSYSAVCKHKPGRHARHTSERHDPCPQTFGKTPGHYPETTWGLQSSVSRSPLS